MRRIHLHVASAGNEVMTHIAEILASGFAAIGVATRIVVDGRPLADAAAGAASLIVAPHEFFTLHFLKTHPTIEVEPTLAASAVVNVEQPGSTWFDTAWEFARGARVVFDISRAGVVEFERRGARAHHAPLGWSPVLEAADRQPLVDRPLDILFLGHASPRRKAFFARHAEVLSRRRCHIVLSEVHVPRTAATPGFHSGDERLDLVASSRLLLCVHSTDRPYFEQHRAMLALANGTLLVTETSRYTDPLRENEHFVSAALDELPALCERLLDAPATLQHIAEGGRRFAVESMSVEDTCRAMAAVLTSSSGTATVGDSPERMAVKSRLLEASRREACGDPPWTSSVNAAYGRVREPGVSVLLTVYNYGQYVGRALESVVAAHPPDGGVEIVVVDDASADGSSDLVAQWMATTETPVALVRKTLNTGLADARNVALKWARGRRVFVLDADNWIYPPCLAVLNAAMDEHDLAAAYGIIARVEEETGDGVDLISSLAWSPRRLIEGPYLDAMAMFDRGALVEAGGYSVELIDHGWFGWEDYDLWLKLAQAGRTCRLVPRIVAGYRDHRNSMLRRTNRDSESLAAYFRTKFANLLARYPGLDTYFAFPAATTDRLSPEQAEIRGLREHATALERQIADVRASKSWKITRPLRAIGDLLGKRRS